LGPCKKSEDDFIANRKFRKCYIKILNRKWQKNKYVTLFALYMKGNQLALLKGK
jgi:hypothetical protein